jgi:hypothetical protein
MGKVEILATVITRRRSWIFKRIQIRASKALEIMARMKCVSPNKISKMIVLTS